MKSKFRRGNQPLTAHERWLFSLTTSQAETNSGKRAAIAREGLSGMSRADVRAERLRGWKKFRAKTGNKGLPAWLVAARFDDSDNWRRVAPVKAGTVTCVDGLRYLAYDSADWGRLRKRGRGSASHHTPRVREEDNGQTGFRRVVWRHADYLSIISPDGLKIAVQVCRLDKIEYHAIRNGRFCFRGAVISIESAQTAPPRSWRVTGSVLRRLARPGWTVVYTPAIAGGPKHWALRDARGEEYHFRAAERTRSPVSDAAHAFIAREQESESAKIARILDSGKADGVYVCAADSLKSGNCESGTTEWISRHHITESHRKISDLRGFAPSCAIRRAMIGAIKRSRAEDTRGYSILADHFATN